MAIEIIDGFQINSSIPIDNRMVVNDLTERNNILYKYEGLKVFVLSDGTTHVWYNDQWQVDNSKSVTTSNTSTNYIPKLTSSNTITNSVIYEISGNIGIGTTILSANEKLKVNGNIIVVGNGSKFIGDGSGLTNINASNLIGSISVDNISNGATNSIIISGPTKPIWASLSDLSVGVATNTNNVFVTNDTTSTNSTFISIVSNTGTYTNIRSATNLRYIPSKNQLLLHNVGTSSAPTIGFFGSSTTGIYRNNSESTMCFAMESKDVLKLHKDGIKIVNNTFTYTGTYSIGTGTQGDTTKLTISAQNYDRIIYLTTSPLNNIYFLSSGWFQTTIFIDSIQIYTSFSDSQFGHKTFQQNYCFILPANKVAYIRQSKGDVMWKDGLGNTFGSPDIYIRSLRYGL
ncbi:MAG: hypothetical protein M0R46_06730 [Candidatus Muirbacterium halophilum]|nr:hypothetical protein [Candidatus Muirbacterium halophilum]